MGAAYSFVSRWQVAASADECGRELERMLRPGGASWWPGVTVLEAPEQMRVGEHVALRVRSPLGYRIRVRLAVTQWERGRVLAARSEGDLRGSGRISIADEADAAASIVIHWDVETERRWMTLMSPVLRPIFRGAHAWVMRAGERGLRRAIARDV